MALSIDSYFPLAVNAVDGENVNFGMSYSGGIGSETFAWKLSGGSTLSTEQNPTIQMSESYDGDTITGSVSSGGTVLTPISPAVDNIAAGLDVTASATELTVRSNGTASGFKVATSSTSVDVGNSDFVYTFKLSNVSAGVGVNNYVGYRLNNANGEGIFGLVSYFYQTSYMQAQYYNGTAWVRISLSPITHLQDSEYTVSYKASTNEVTLVATSASGTVTKTYTTPILAENSELVHFGFVYSASASAIYGFDITEYLFDNADHAFTDPIPLSVASGGCTGGNYITQDGASVSTATTYGYGTEIELSMERNVSSRGFVQWLDNGRQYDNFKTEYSLVTKQGDVLEEMLAGDSDTVIQITTPVYNGFYPFSQLFATQQSYPVSVTRWSTDGDRDILGEQRDYKLTIEPYTNKAGAYATYTSATEISEGCILNHWQIGGVPFPFSEWEQAINDKRGVISLSGGTSEIVDNTREYGDVVKCKFRVWEEQARQILQFLTSVMRGTVQTATFPDTYNIFGRRYSGLTTCSVKLWENILKVSHNNYGEVVIECSFQMVGL